MTHLLTRSLTRSNEATPPRVVSPRGLATIAAGTLLAWLAVFTLPIQPAFGFDQFAPPPVTAEATEACQVTDRSHVPFDRWLGQFTTRHEEQSSVDGTRATQYYAVTYNKVTKADRKKLQQYIAKLTSSPPHGCARDAQMVYWINLYNALTLDIVLEEVPVESIRDIGSWPNAGPLVGPWQEDATKVDGVTLSLNNIEHDILRPLFKDHRIHFAVNCASYSCPTLLDRAWHAKTLEADLQEAERQYLFSPRGITTKPADDGAVYVSSIFSWYQADFANNEGALRQYFAERLESSPTRQQWVTTRTIEYDYDWRLNNKAFDVR